MSHTIAWAIFGGAGGFALGVQFGQARARAYRAWRDLKQTKEAITGLWKRTVAEWRIVLKYSAIVVGVVVGAVWMLIHG